MYKQIMKPRNFFYCLILLINTLLFGGRIITKEDIADLHYVFSPAISSDGDNIAYVLSVPREDDENPGPRHSEIWVKRINDQKPVRFTSTSYDSYAPQWSWNGKNITFLSRRNKISKLTQLYSIPIDGGEANLFLEHSTNIGTYLWSPNGAWIAFLSIDTLSDKKIKNIEKGYDMIVKDRNYLFKRLWLHNIRTGKTDLVFNNDLYVHDFIWSDDSKTIVFQGTDKPGADPSLMDRKLFKVKIPRNRPRKILDTPGKLGAMNISPDGMKLAFLGAMSRNDPLSQSVFIVHLNKPEKLISYQGKNESFYDLQWVDNKTLLTRSIRGTKTILSLIQEQKIKNKTNLFQKDIYSPDYIISSARLHRKSGQLLITGNSNKHPNELFIKDLFQNNLVRITISNSFIRDLDLGQQETITWSSIGGYKIQGVVTYPPNYRKGSRYPLILQIHGGPEGVTLDGWNTSAGYPVQLLAAEGYIVLQPNYRGSGGRGVDFSKSDHNDLGGLEYQDVLQGIDHLIKAGAVNAGKVGTGGWSYGGYFSALGATAYSHRFKASMVGAGLTNMISFMGTTDIPYEMSLVHWNSWWFDEMDLHWERSPLSHINKAKTPTLIIHGLQDERVHPEQGIELYQALKIKGVDTELVLYPREPHGLTERAHQLDYMDRLIKWYNKYVK
tara:strand:+ start:15072 stop:17072 length:2001 start_codon:yes stop_codon:yes gene_type:complete